MSMEFETRAPSYLDNMEGPGFSMLDSSMDYIHYEQSPSPNFGSSINLNDFHLSSALMEPFSSTYTPSGAYTTSPPRPYSPALESTGISPPSLSYHMSGGEASSDESRSNSGRLSRGENPTPPPLSYATVPRSHRYNPLATRTSARSVHKRRGSKSSTSIDHDSDAEEEEDYQPSSGGVQDPRREAVRKQRIESEQRRRDELRDGYARLKTVLPPSTAKSSKVNLLDRAAHHIKHIESINTQQDARLKAAETEINRLRSINEMLSLRAVQQRESQPTSGMSSFN